MACVAAHGAQVGPIETADTDNIELGPAKSAREGEAFEWHTNPDGFYLVGDNARPTPEFQWAPIDAVRHVTRIVETDVRGRIIGDVACFRSDLVHSGV